MKKVIKAKFELRRKTYDKKVGSKAEAYDRKVVAHSDMFERKKQAKIRREHGKWGQRMSGFDISVTKRRPGLGALEHNVPGGGTKVRDVLKPIHGVPVKIIGINKAVHGVGGNRASKKRAIIGGVESEGLNLDRLSLQDERMKRTREKEKMRREVESERIERQRGIAGERGEAGMTWREKMEEEHETRAEEEAERVKAQKAGEYDRSLAWISRGFMF